MVALAELSSQILTKIWRSLSGNRGGRVIETDNAMQCITIVNYLGPQ